MDNGAENDLCVSYIWRSSIPTRWVKLRGEEHFRPANPLHRTQSTIELLYQRLHPRKPLHKSESGVWGVSHSPIRLAVRGKLQRNRMALDGVRGVSEDYGQAQDVKLMSAAKEKQVKCVLYRGVKQAACGITTIGLNADVKNEPNRYAVHKYARPKALIPVPKEKSGDELHLQQSAEMREFLQRFEARTRPVIPPRGRKGFNGWKLTKAKDETYLDADIGSFQTSFADSSPFKFL